MFPVEDDGVLRPCEDGNDEDRERQALLGIRFDAYSSYLRGAGAAPPKIREALRCDASNSWTETGVDLGVAGVYEDDGDLEFAGAEAEKNAFAAIEAGVGALLEQG